MGICIYTAQIHVPKCKYINVNMDIQIQFSSFVFVYP